jgi:hypothetical protein
MINSCKLAREAVIMKDDGCWIPDYRTIYSWFREFTSNGREFPHPELKLHQKNVFFDSLDEFFMQYPTKLESLKEYVYRVKFERNGASIIQISYDIFHFFVEKLANGSASRVNGAAMQKSDMAKNNENPVLPVNVGPMAAPVPEFVASFDPFYSSSSMSADKENTNDTELKKDDIIKAYNLEGLKWMTFYDWMEKNDL